MSAEVDTKTRKRKSQDDWIVSERDATRRLFNKSMTVDLMYIHAAEEAEETICSSKAVNDYIGPGNKNRNNLVVQIDEDIGVLVPSRGSLRVEDYTRDKRSPDARSFVMSLVDMTDREKNELASFSFLQTYDADIGNTKVYFENVEYEKTFFHDQAECDKREMEWLDPWRCKAIMCAYLFTSNKIKDAKVFIDLIHGSEPDADIGIENTD